MRVSVNVTAQTGIDIGQGYFIARPMPFDDLLTWAVERCSREPVTV